MSSGAEPKLRPGMGFGKKVRNMSWNKMLNILNSGKAETTECLILLDFTV